MVKYYKNKNGYAYAICEYRITDKQGNIKENGDYLYVEYMWIHKKKKQDKLIERFSHDILDRTPSVRYVWFKRFKYGDRDSMFEVKRKDNKFDSFEKKELLYG